MPELPRKKVGIVACSGEELAEGTVTRLAALRVLEQLRPADTVTICLPLFLAGGEGDRAFARFYPTIAIDGCDQRCAARATEMFSGRPAASVVITDLAYEQGLGKAEGLRRLNEAGSQTVEVAAQHVAQLVDALLDKHWDRRHGEFVQEKELPEAGQSVQATCSCGSGIPIQEVEINGQTVALVALPLIFEQLHQDGIMPVEGKVGELLETVRVYNPVPATEEEAYATALLLAYASYCKNKEAVV